MTDTRDYLTVRRLHPDNADRAEKYRAALEQIKRLDEKRQYGSCMLCISPTQCDENRKCANAPHTEIGKIAAKALEEV